MRPRLFAAVLAAAAAAALGGGALLADPASAATAAGTTASFTSLSVSTSSITLGHDSAVLLSVRVTANSLFITPTGTVTIEETEGSAVRHLCTATLAGSGPNSATGSCRMSDTALFPGPRQLFAVYGGSSSLAISQSPDVPVTVSPAVTQLSLAQSGSQVAFGQESADTMTVTASPTLPGEFAPSGEFVIVARINGVTTPICFGALPANVDAATNTGTCTLTDTAVPIGLFTIEAHYLGDGVYAGSVSPATALKVSQGQSTTRLGLPSASLAFDQENGAPISFAVGPQTGILPGGQISVSAVSTASGQTTPLCSGPLANATGGCQLAAARLAPGNYLVTATYGGDTNYAGSSSTAKPLTITQVPSQTALNRSPAKIKFGHEQAERLSVQVSARNGGTPGGKVTIKAGTVTLCTITLNRGKGSCALTARKLQVGTYHLVASYLGGALFAKSASGKVTLTVTK